VQSYEIKNFNSGWDTRRDTTNAPAGTLRKLRNAVITAGGEIAKVQPFELFATAPTTSVGLLGDQQYIYTVAKTGDAAAAAPGPTTLGVLNVACPVSLQELFDYDRWAGQFYVVVYGVDGITRHYLNGVDVPVSDDSYNVKLHRRKMYRLGGDGVVRFSVSGDPATLADAGSLVGSGSFAPPEYDSEMTNPGGIEVYYSDIAIFSAYAAQIWAINADPAQNQYKQTLRQAGTIAWRSVKQYGSGDVLYLAADGIRSLRARDESLAASVSDIGSPLDPVISDLRREKGIWSYLRLAISLLEPYSGRFWLVLPDRIFVLSAFPTPHITAWSEIAPPFVTGGVTITGAAVGGDKIFLRDSTHKVWAYGDHSGPAVMSFAERPPAAETRGPDPRVVYSGALVDIEFPFLSMEKPSQFKTFQSLDVSCEGDWDIYAAFDPANPTAEELIGRCAGTTFPARRFALAGYSTHCSIRMRHQNGAQKATISSFMFHYDPSEKD